MAPRTPVGPLVLTALAHGSVASYTPAAPAAQVRSEQVEQQVGRGERSTSLSSSSSSSTKVNSNSKTRAAAGAGTRPFPNVDQHLVVPEVSQFEQLDGRKVENVGSLPPHADAQALTGFLLAAHVLRAYVVATELLTRSSVDSDFATDVCIRKRGIDPETKTRYLEELSFEIVNEQSLTDVTAKAKNLAQRGVRRVFAIFVKSGDIREWSRDTEEFVDLDKNGLFDDAVFIRPIAVHALVDSTLAEAENEVAKALIAKQNPEIAKVQHEAEQKGLDVGRNMLRSLVKQRFGALPGTLERQIAAATPEQLQDWTARLFNAGSLDQLFV